MLSNKTCNQSCSNLSMLAHQTQNLAQFLPLTQPLCFVKVKSTFSFSDQGVMVI